MSNSVRKIALVVGVGSTLGLGSAIARRFASGGYHIVVVGRSENKLALVVADLQSRTGGTAEALVGDASSDADVARFVAHASSAGDLDIVVYNAGQNRRESIFDLSPQTFEMFWREHTLGGFLVGQAAAKIFRDKGQGSIIFTGASGSLRGKAGFAAFAAAKAGLRALNQSMARELGPLGIHVAHVIVDGGIEGERLLSRSPDEREKRGPDGLLNIDAIAETYWMLHQQHRSAWTLELDLRPWTEPF